MSKSLKAFLIIISIVCVAILIYFLYNALLISFVLFPAQFEWVGALIYESPPKPQIKYAEFPFSVTYSINDEPFVLEDILVFEFDGFEVITSAGKYRKWKRYVKSNGEDRIYLHKGEEYLLYLNIGTAEYYMGGHGMI